MLQASSNLHLRRMFCFFVCMSACTQLHRPHVLLMAAGGTIPLMKPSWPGYLSAGPAGPKPEECVMLSRSRATDSCQQVSSVYRGYLPLPLHRPNGLISWALSADVGVGGWGVWGECCKNHLQRCSNSCFTLTFWEKLLIHSALIFNPFLANLHSVEVLKHFFAELLAFLLLILLQKQKQKKYLLQLFIDKMSTFSKTFQNMQC